MLKKDTESCIIQCTGLWRTISTRFEELTSVIPNICQYISPTLNVAHELQKEIGNCNLRSTAVSNVGLWQSSVCVNCQTSSLHTENDCTYTIITTPNQNISTVPYFLFDIKKGFTIGLEMNPGLTFMFSGKYLYHRQMILDEHNIDKSCYINLSSYGSEKLFNNFNLTY